jgi:carbon storage regulator
MSQNVAAGGSTMLVLTRKEGESMVIDRKILVTVVKIQPDQVSLQLEAPMEYSIQFGENEPVHYGAGSTALISAQRKNDSFALNGEGSVTVVEIRGDKVRLGFVLPREWELNRKEVFDAINREAQ